MIKTSLILGTILVWLAIILGAFGAHFLKTKLDTNQLASIETGIRYQLIQGIAIVVLSLNSDKFKFPLRKILNSMIIGLCLFSFSIYLLVFFNKIGLHIPFLGLITPIGGAILIGSWIYLTICLLRKS